jgi:hypothetical protein
MGNFLTSPTEPTQEQLNVDLSMLEIQPCDHIRHLCTFLSFEDIVNMSHTSKALQRSIKYITNITIPGYDYSLKRKDSDGTTKRICEIVKAAKSAHTINISNYFIHELAMIEIAENLPKKLKYLVLHNVGMSDKGLEVLMKNVPKSLKVLKLDYNELGDVGISNIVKHLSRLPSLYKISLKKIGMTRQGFTLLRRVVVRNSHIKKVDSKGNYIYTNKVLNRLSNGSFETTNVPNPTI